MNRLKKLALIISFSVFYNLNAQQIVKKDTLSGTVLTTTMDSKVSDLMESLEESCSRQGQNDSDKTSGGTSRILVPNRPLTNAEICRKNPRILGYKIQVAVVKSNEEANKIRTEFRKIFPGLKVQLDASLRPNYKILAGSYFTKEDAKSDLAQVRKTFESATTIQYQIFCVDAK